MYFQFVSLFRFLSSLFFSCFLWIVSTVIAGGVFLQILFFLVYFLGSYIFCVYSFSGCTAVLAYALNNLWQFLVTSLPDLHPTQLAWTTLTQAAFRRSLDSYRERPFQLLVLAVASSFLQHLPILRCDVYLPVAFLVPKGRILAGLTSATPQ